MAGQTSRPTHSTTSSDTIALITNTVMPAIQGIQNELILVKSELGHLKTTTEEKFNCADEIVAMLRKELYGNGNPSDQAGLKADVIAVKRWIEEKKNDNRWVQRTLVAAVVVEGIGLIKLIFFG